MAEQRIPRFQELDRLIGVPEKRPKRRHRRRWPSDVKMAVKDKNSIRSRVVARAGDIAHLVRARQALAEKRLARRQV